MANSALPDGAAVGITEQDVFDLNSKQLDQYMDWYDQAWIADAEPTRGFIASRECRS